MGSLGRPWLRRPLLIWVLLGLLSVSSGVRSFSDSSLWLPGAYQKLAPELRQAALKLEQTERCVKVLRGSLHDSTKSLDEAVFLLVCRDENRQTYSALANAQTLELTFLLPEVVAPPLEELTPEQQRAELAELKQQRFDQFQEACEQLFANKTRYMKNLVRIDQGSLVVKEEGEALSMVMPFDAVSLRGAPLQYQATCSSDASAAEVSLAITARKTDAGL